LLRLNRKFPSVNPGSVKRLAKKKTPTNLENAGRRGLGDQERSRPSAGDSTPNKQLRRASGGSLSALVSRCSVPFNYFLTLKNFEAGG